MTSSRPLRTLTLSALLMVVSAGAAGAQNREHLQMQADLRMLQEQLSQLRLVVNQLGEWATGTDTRLDAMDGTVVRKFADQDLVIDQIVSTLATMREKLDDNTTRVSQLTQESSAIREGLRLLTEQINALILILRPPPDPDEVAEVQVPVPGGEEAPGVEPAVGLVSVPASPATYMDDALNNFFSGRYDLAIEAFREVIDLFPDSPQAATAQFSLGEAYYSQNQCARALPEYRRLTDRYPESPRVADAYLMQGICLRELKQEAEARRMFEQVIQRFPGTPLANQAEQLLR